jgi:hypothetical protein
MTLKPGSLIMVMIPSAARLQGVRSFPPMARFAPAITIEGCKSLKLTSLPPQMILLNLHEAARKSEEGETVR